VSTERRHGSLTKRKIDEQAPTERERIPQGSFARLWPVVSQEERSHSRTMSEEASPPLRVTLVTAAAAVLGAGALLLIARNHRQHHSASELSHIRNHRRALRGAELDETTRSAISPNELVIGADDVSRVSKTRVARIIYCVSEEDIVSSIQRARLEGLRVSVRGEAHTMGGQTLSEGGVLLDMSQRKRVFGYTPVDDVQGHGLVTCEAGATWGDVIAYLNVRGSSPMTMQSYCSFSVGGTISVNAHGITTDRTIAESVERIRFVDCDGQIRECSRTDGREWFRHIIGGYGLFGVISEVVLRTVPNTKLSLEMLRLEDDEFLQFYTHFLDTSESCNDDDDDDELERDPSVSCVGVKIARMDLSGRDMQLFVFRTTSDLPVVSDLAPHPTELSHIGKVIYKWIAPHRATRWFRSWFEKSFHRPVDWRPVGDRNGLMYESAKPLSSLYNGFGTLFRVDDTFFLQEYFVPPRNFAAFVATLRKRLGRTGRWSILLNITVRAVMMDHLSALPYAREDMIAFVLYWRLRRTAEAEAELEDVHKDLCRSAMSLGGTFYLPYRHHYTEEDLVAGHPAICQFFFDKSNLFDPADVFDNRWFSRWKHVAANGRSEQELEDFRHEVASLQVADFRPPAPRDALVLSTVLTRGNSVSRVIDDMELRVRLQYELGHRLRVLSTNAIYETLCKIAWRPDISTDDEAYLQLFNDLAAGSNGKTAFQRHFFRTRVHARREFREQVWRSNMCARCVSLLEHVGAASGGVSGLLSVGGPRFDPLAHELGSAARIQHEVVSRESLGDLGNLPKQSVSLAVLWNGLQNSDPDSAPGHLRQLATCVKEGGLVIMFEEDAALFDEPDTRHQLRFAPLFSVLRMVGDAEAGVEPENHTAGWFQSLADARGTVCEAGFEDALLLDSDQTSVGVLFTKPSAM
jgi:FAD/FMN-containing dehydrogenase